MSGLLAILLFVGLLFSFAPVLLGVFVALWLMGLAAVWLFGKRAKELASESAPVVERSSPPARSELPRRPPSDEAMRAEETPGRSN